MKAVWTAAGAALLAGLVGASGVASAQGYYGGGRPDFNYRGGDYGNSQRYDDRDDDRSYRGRDRDRDGFDRRRQVQFDEREYLRCNPDVLRAVRRGEMQSGLFHWRRHGQGERRRLTC